MSDRQALYEAILANSPINFNFALRIWGDDSVNLSDDATRRAFFAVWALASAEHAEAVSRAAADHWQERAVKAELRLAEYENQTCNCRWNGETQVAQCELHEAHVDAIHEWAERAKVAELRLQSALDLIEIEGLDEDGSLRIGPDNTEKLIKLMRGE